MTRFIRNNNLIAQEIPPIHLTLSRINGHCSWSYSVPMLTLSDSSAHVEIELKYFTNDGSSAAISAYASTGVSAEHGPISSFKLPPGGNSAAFDIALFDGQLIDFGVFVTITQGVKPPVTIFCDPQASNDPIKQIQSPP